MENDAPVAGPDAPIGDSGMVKCCAASNVSQDHLYCLSDTAPKLVCGCGGGGIDDGCRERRSELVHGVGDGRPSVGERDVYTHDQSGRGLDGDEQ